MAGYAMKLKQVLAILKHPGNSTPYERENGITPTTLTCMVDRECMKMYLLGKSDGTRTIVLVFRTTMNADSWLIWIITEEQAEFMLIHFPIIYLEIDRQNKEARNAQYKAVDRCDSP